MSCVECGESSKYKCPICREPYCSVSCCKQHKTKTCSPQPESQDVEKEDYDNDIYEFPTEDTIPPKKLELLGKSKELNKCLENPHVREILKILDSTHQPDKLLKEYMQEPIFTEFVDICLNIIQDKSDS